MITQISYLTILQNSTTETMHLERSTTSFTSFPYKELWVLHEVRVYTHICSLKVSLLMLSVTQVIQC